MKQKITVMKQDVDYLREVEPLWLQWSEEMKRTRGIYRTEALLNVVFYIQNGLHGIRGRWAAEAEEREQATPFPSSSFPNRADFIAFIGAHNHYLVAEAMCSVADKMVRKTYQGKDKAWFGLVQGDDGQDYYDDDSNTNVAVAMLLNEEVKLRQAADFLLEYLCLLGEEKEEQAQRHLIAFVRSNLALTPGHDLWAAMKQSDANLAPHHALLLELRGELADPLPDLTPLDLRTLPSRTAYRIRQRLLAPKSEADAFFDLENVAAQALGVEAFTQEELHREALRDLCANMMERGLTESQAEVWVMKKLSDQPKEPTLAEIALELGKPIGTIRSHFHRAKEKVEKMREKSSI